MRIFVMVVFGFAAVNGAYGQDLFQRNHQALERAQQRNFEPPPQQGRTGYVERGYRNNSGNDSQSRQLDQQDRDD